MAFRNAFQDKSVIVTGHTGFKGSWLVAWLYSLGAHITGLSVSVPTEPSHFRALNLDKEISDIRVDLCDYQKVRTIVEGQQPDYIFHLAAQSLVQKSYIDPISTYQSNVFGTLSVLEALRSIKKPCVAVLVTSDKCYNNVEWDRGYSEVDTLGGSDPYSGSKAAAELVIQAHIKSFFDVNSSPVKIGVGRAGNVIGGGDWAPDRVVPDCMSAWENGGEAILRSPDSIRPWQHVLEPLSGYLTLADQLNDNAALHGEAFNFGPQSGKDKTVRELVEGLSTYWEEGSRYTTITQASRGKESKLLKLNCDKALELLNWSTVLDFTDTVKMTVDWYRNYYLSLSASYDFTSEQIRLYEQLAVERELAWVRR